MVQSTNSLKAFSVISLILVPLIHFGQSSLGSQANQGQAFFAYYQAGQYQDVIKSLKNEKDMNANQQIILYLSEQKTGNIKGREIKEWIDNNPDHPLKSLARFNYAELAFYKGDTVSTKKYLSRIRSKELAESDQASYAFMTGVIVLQEKKYKTAKNYFNQAKKNKYPHQSQLYYYQAFTSYHLNDLTSALSDFNKAKSDSEYEVSSKYFIAKIYLETGEYDKVVALAQGELSDEVSETNSGFYQILGEAYAQQDDVAKADAFFDKAIQKHPRKPSPALYYQAGVSKFKIGNMEKALTYLTESGIGSGPYAKLSAFQLGRLHIQRNEPEKALAAYMEASSAEDKDIKEESIYQSAMLNAKLGRYSEAINYGTDYLDNYANGQWEGEIKDMLAQSYLRTSDYDKAIAQLEKSGISNAIQKEVYQKVTYQKALLEFNDGNFDDASAYFLNSLKYQNDSDLTNETYFYLGEIYLKKNNYQRAISAYRAMNLITPEAHYGIGYGLYNQQKYGQAIPHFDAAISVDVMEMKQDARLRLADCYYTTKAYSDALNIYRRLPQIDYVLFQQGMVLRNLNRNTDAIKNFELVPSSSNFKDDALFYKAQINFENADFEKAENGFTSLISRHSDSPYIPKAYLNRAISRNNLGKYELANDDYNYVIENHLQREEAFSAILGLQDLQQKGVKVGNLDKNIADYKKANPGNGSLEVVEFEAAKGIYFDLDYAQAIPKIKSFLKEYPQSKFKIEASYYLGDAYFRTDQLKESRKVFDDQRFLRNEYTGRILYRLGDINYELKDFDKAIENYQLLLELNLTPKDNHNARNGLMLSSYDKGDFQQAIFHANQVIQSDWKPLNAEPTAQLLKARSYLNLGEIEESRNIYKQLAGGEDHFAAEASYMVALLAYRENNYDQSLDLLFDLTARLGSYTEWIEKSYLLISENYIAKDELFQAKATLRSIIQHSQSDETKRIATEMLESIEQDNVSDSLKQGNR